MPLFIWSALYLNMPHNKDMTDNSYPYLAEMLRRSILPDPGQSGETPRLSHSDGLSFSVPSLKPLILATADSDVSSEAQKRTIVVRVEVSEIICVKDTPVKPGDMESRRATAVATTRIANTVTIKSRTRESHF